MARKALGPNALAVVAAVRPWLAADEGSPRRRAVRIACSGGPDSLALAAAAAWVQTHCPDPLREMSAMVIDHGLQHGSAAVATEAARQVTALGIPAEVVLVNVAVDSPDGLESAARDARYAALRGGGAMATSPDLVLLGHTLDDQAETVLLGLARGSGTRSLAGMPERFGVSPEFIRPLLRLRRAATTAACAEFGLTPWQDPQNADPRFLRARIRAELMPRLAEVLGPGVTEALARTADLARADADQLDALAATVLATARTDAGALHAATVATTPASLQGRVIRQWLAAYHLELSYERTQAVLALLTDWHGQGPVQVPGGTVVRAAANLIFIKS
ncbi:MAG: tRNA lysidine(34) synthetase TilS [Propionibacteriaceae bacterium]|jgi:tRNA(Ile)-lysidine synthase|nr:tRNA lysidine(34) synthetase TilS [Propionibacteriaceae bacterium]